jgi:hypothetical protein
MKLKKKYLWAIGIAAVIIVAAIFIFGGSASSKNYESLAKCLASKNTTMYGAYWCPHCQNTKAELGESFKYINYVECASVGSNDQNLVCKDANITGYPTWIISGFRFEGEIAIDQLARISGCPA